MDVGTQGLASLVVARAFVPRAPWRAWAVIVVAGSIANIDVVSAMASPSAFIGWHRTYAHSVVVSLVLSLALATGYVLATRDRAEMDHLPGRTRNVSQSAFFAATVFAGFLHLTLDAAQSDGTMIFWPVSHRRVALDWLPHIDLWIIAILLAALLLPELTRLVTDEIGAKSSGARGRVGAIVGLVVLALYVGMRADLHSNAIATLQSRGTTPDSRVASPRTRTPRRHLSGMASSKPIARSTSLTSAFSTGSQFDADNGSTLFKPEPSPILDQAQRTEAARKFLAVAQFPKADIETPPTASMLRYETYDTPRPARRSAKSRRESSGSKGKSLGR